MNFLRKKWKEDAGSFSIPIWLFAVFFLPWLYDKWTDNSSAYSKELTHIDRKLDYEKKFYADEDKEVETGKTPPTMIRVRTANGKEVTGKWLFVTKCPAGYLCAQPDGSLEDADGYDWNDPPEPERPQPF